MKDQERQPTRTAARPWTARLRQFAPLLVLVSLAIVILVLIEGGLSASSLSWALFPFGIALGLLAVILFFVIRTIRFGTIRQRLLISFILAVLLPLLVIGAIVTISSTRILESHVFAQLESTAALKEAELNRLAGSLHTILDGIFLPSDRAGLAGILRRDQEPDELSREQQARLQIRLVEAARNNQLFSEIFLLNPSGQIVLSTEPQAAAKLRAAGQDYAQEPIFIQAWLGPYITPSISSFGEDGQHTYATIPVEGPDGQYIGILAGRVRLDALQAVLQKEKILGQTGEIYLVAGDRTLVTPTRWNSPPGSVHSAGTDQVVGLRQAGSGLYTGPHGQTVFGVYRWLPDLNMALIIEQDYDEALAPVRAAAALNIGTALLALLIAVVAALYVTRSITRPLEDLARVAVQITQGDLHLRVKVERQDEVGALANVFNTMAGQLQQEIASLEQRVHDRTQDLESRRRQIQTAAEVARDIAAAPDLETLLDQAVELIRSRFGFYHAGIFLLDAKGEYAVLRAATGEAGRELLARGHRLKVGETGLVGFVTAYGQPRIAQDVGADQFHFENPLLPDTRSELALPLRQQNRITGALDVQSSQPDAFAEEDVAILQTMADQLAVAIEKAHLIRQMNETLQELEEAHGRFTESAWSELVRKKRGALDLRYNQVEVLPVKEPHPEALLARQTGRPVIFSAGQAGAQDLLEGHSALAVPIRLREQVIGVLNLRFSSPEVPAETAAVVEEISARLALVLENARLFQEAQERAGRERLIGGISDKMQRANDLDRLVNLTLRELQEALGATYAVVQFSEPDDDRPDETLVQER